MKRKKMSDADREQRDAALRNIERLRHLAEKAQTELDRRKQQRAST